MDMFELPLQLAREEIPRTLVRGLESLIIQGASLAWLMFDGAFQGVSSLATDWGARNTYGIAGPTIPARLALDQKERTAEDWREVVRRAVESFTFGLAGSQGE